MKLSVVILAAGQSTRMNSGVPKVLHPVAGRPMIRYGVLAAGQLGAGRPTLVIGHCGDQVREFLGDEAEYVNQTERRGTGHAVMQARDLVEPRGGSVLIFYGDMPLLRAETLQSLVELHAEHRSHSPLTMLTVVADDPMGFGRVVRDVTSRVLAVVEEAEATEQQREIKELNCGVYCFESEWLWSHLAQIPLSPKGEYYLTDLIEMAAGEGYQIAAWTIDDVTEVLGINNRVQLANAERVIRRRINERWMQAGVTMIDPQTTYIEADVQIGQDTVIQPHTHVQGNTQIGERCRIGPNSIIRDSMIGSDCKVFASVVESAILEDGVDIGPFGHLRRGAHLAAGVHMGNFGEVKNSYLGAGTKMGHFSYLGDAQVGQNVNIGAGTITCNYDGQQKHKTVIEDEAFIGSDSMLVAPVRIGAGAKTGAGSVVTHDVPPGATAIGVPARLQERSAKETGARAKSNDAADKTEIENSQESGKN